MIKCNDNSGHGWAIVSMKLAVATFVIIVLKIWTGAMNWVHATNIWWFVAALVIFVVLAGGCCGSEYCPVSKTTKKVAKKKK